MARSFSFSYRPLLKGHFCGLNDAVYLAAVGFHRGLPLGQIVFSQSENLSGYQNPSGDSLGIEDNFINAAFQKGSGSKAEGKGGNTDAQFQKARG